MTIFTFEQKIIVPTEKKFGYPGARFFAEAIEIQLSSNTPMDNFPVAVIFDNSLYRFTEAGISFYDNTTEIPFWVESWETAELCKVWVRVPTMGTSTIRIVARVGALSSDGNEVFDFFDDFPGSSLDTDNKWVPSHTGYFSVSEGFLNVSGGSVYPKLMVKNKNYRNRPLVLTAKIIHVGGTISNAYNIYSASLHNNGVGMYGEGSYDRKLIINNVSSWKAGANVGHHTSTVIYETHIGTDRIRQVARRDPYPFDDTWMGDTNLSVVGQTINFFRSFFTTYKVPYVYVRDYGDITGEVQ